jgi:hypothetical protein
MESSQSAHECAYLQLDRVLNGGRGRKSHAPVFGASLLVANGVDLHKIVVLLRDVSPASKREEAASHSTGLKSMKCIRHV